MSKSAISTTYRGINFRSRLEATWAAFFDAIGWEWEYEPFDFNGYIPDFLLKWEIPIYIEVKPFIEYNELLPAKKKALDSGCSPICVVGGSPFYWAKDVIVLGPGGACPDEDYFFLDSVQFVGCEHCQTITAMSENGQWTCLRCGVYNSGGYMLFPRFGGSEKIKRAWAQAKNQTQWNGYARKTKSVEISELKERIAILTKVRDAWSDELFGRAKPGSHAIANTEIFRVLLERHDQFGRERRVVNEPLGIPKELEAVADA